MNGTLIWNPPIIATGKTRRATLRKHAQLLWNDCLEARMNLPESLDVLMQKFLLSTESNEAYWTARGNSSCPEKTLEELLQLASYFTKKCPSLKALSNYEESLLIKSNHEHELWIILKIDPKQAIKRLDELRAAGLRVSASAWGPHISVVRNEKIAQELIQSQPSNNLVFNFESNMILRTNRQGYYWYDCESLELEAFRTSLGLSPRPPINWHMTLGRLQ